MKEDYAALARKQRIHDLQKSTPEQRLDWLAAAVEFACAPKKIVKDKATHNVS
jgi:hypothetical protein